jgi:hypothetical protein
MNTALIVRTSAPDFGRLARTLAGMSRDTVFSHRTAAQIWGIWVPPFDGIEVTTPARERGSRYTTSVQRRRVVAHRRITPPTDIVERHGLPVTCPGRTWIDLAPFVDLHDLIAAGDSALRVGATLTELEERAAVLRCVRGARAIRRAVRHLDARSRSRPESRIRGAIVLAGLPKPEVNEPIFDSNGGWLAEPDLSYDEAKLALEYNGSDHATSARMGKDATRLLGMQRDEWTVRTYTAVDAFRRLDAVVHDVDVQLRRLAPQLLTRAYQLRTR